MTFLVVEPKHCQECGREVARLRRGSCESCYRRALDAGRFEPIVRGTCTFPGCDRPNKSSGLCSAHWQQSRRGVELKPIGVPRNRPDAEPAAATDGQTIRQRKAALKRYRAEPTVLYHPTGSEGVHGVILRASTVARLGILSEGGEL